MSRSKWSLVFGSLAALGLLVCQNLARGDELESAPQPPDGSSAPVQKPVLQKENTNACVQQACNGEMCINRNWIVDVDAVWLAPIQHQNFGSVGFGTLTGTPLAPVGSTATADTTNPSDFTLSPRITLGVQGDCWGVLVRYWHLQTGDLSTDLAPSVPLPTFLNGTSSSSVFEAETFDLEVTRLLAGNNEDNMFRASFGFRYAQLEEAAGLAFGGVDYGGVFARHEFSGPGVTCALQGVHQVNGTNFNLFFDARGSFIVDNNATTYAASTFDGVGKTDPETSNADLFIGEFQLGGQWNLPLKCMPAIAFVRFAFEYQYWATTNGTDAVANIPTGVPGLFANSTASGNTHIDMVGFNIGAGLTW